MSGLECRVKLFLKKHKEIYKSGSKYSIKKSAYEVKIPRKINKDLCRLLGILHGDGNMSLNRIHFSDKSKKYHETVIGPTFQKIFGIKLNTFHDINRNTYYSHIKSKIIYRLLVEVFEIPEGSVRKSIQIPEVLKKATKKQKSAYIAGLFDAESHICKREARISFYTTSINLFNFVKDFLEEINIKYSIYSRFRRKNKEYEINLYGKNNIKKFIEIVEMKHPDKTACLFLHFPVH